VMLFNKESVQVQAIRYALRPTEGYGHFFILASGQSGITTPEGLKGVEIGVSQGTVIEYVTERLLQSEGLSTNEIKTIPVPKIPDRMSLLASGELSAATLPDPLGALAVQSGASIVLDDSNYPEYGFSIYSFRKEVIDGHPEAIQGFLAAVDEAIELINADPTQYTDILSEANIPRRRRADRGRMGGCAQLGQRQGHVECECLVCGLCQRHASSLICPCFRYIAPGF
jgi:NitT/TauT family transport system substrate-binding protein